MGDSIEYRIFRLTFQNGLHVGNGSLDDSSIQLRADTIFSALCIESLKVGGEKYLNRLVAMTRSGDLLISDAFPFVDDEYYLTKPIFSIYSSDTNEDSDENEESVKKIFKKLKYIPLSMYDIYMAGELSGETADYITKQLTSKLGKPSIFTKVAIEGLEDSLPYHVGVFSFFKNAGLYIIAAGTVEGMSLLRELLRAVSFAGIGGKRTAGLGRFSVEELPAEDELREGFRGSHSSYMTLSCSLPKEEELEQALKGASYALLRRSGFVFSNSYADEPLRKKDMNGLSSGSVIRQRYEGDVYDVSNKKPHPVYRYAKPIFLGVSL